MYINNSASVVGFDVVYILCSCSGEGGGDAGVCHSMGIPVQRHCRCGWGASPRVCRELHDSAVHNHRLVEDIRGCILKNAAVAVVAFSSHGRIFFGGGDWWIIPCMHFFFFKMEIAQAHQLHSLGQGSVHRGTRSWDDWSSILVEKKHKSIRYNVAM